MGDLRVEPSKRAVAVRGERVDLTFVEFEILVALAAQSGPRVHARDAPDADLGRLRLPRPAHDRRPHPPPAREARARREAARTTSSRCAASATGSATTSRDPRVSGSRGAVAIDPDAADAAVLRDHGRRGRLRLRLRHAAAGVLAARRRSCSSLRPPRTPTRGASTTRSTCPSASSTQRARRRRADRERARDAARPRATRARRTRTSSPTPTRRRTSPTCSSRWPTRPSRERKVVTGTERSDDGELGLAAKPLFSGKRVRRVVVFSSPLADVADNVALIRRQILVAGGLGLLLALIASTLVARWISRRVQALEEGAGTRRARRLLRPLPASSTTSWAGSRSALDDMQRQLAQLDSARKRFIATASHELRTPLFSLGGFLELIEDEDLDEETRRAFLRQVRQQVAAAAEAGDRPAGPLAPRGRLAGAAPGADGHRVAHARGRGRSSRPALAAHDSNLELRLRAQPIEADCDPERVAQVLRILMDNALTHTPPGYRPGRERGPAERHAAPRGARLRSGDRPRVARAGLRAVLHLRRRAGLRPWARRSRASWPSA